MGKNKLIGDFDVLAPFRTVFGALRTTNVQEDAFVNGQAFSYEDYLSYNTDEVKDFLFDPTAFIGTNIVIVPPLFAATAGPVLIDYYVGTTASDNGTLLGISNRRGTSTNENQAILRLNPTISNVGTRFTGRLVPATGVNPVQGIGGASSSALPFEVDYSFKYLIRVTNTDGAGVYVQTDLTWLEIT